MRRIMVPPLSAGVEPVEDEGARAPDVQKARGRRRKTNSEHGNFSITGWVLEVRKEIRRLVDRMGASAQDVLFYERGSMSKRELIAREVDRLPDRDLDRLLAYLRLLSEGHADAVMPALAAESALAKDWLTPEEDAAWANL